MLTIFYGFVVVAVTAVSFSVYALAMEGCWWRLPRPVTPAGSQPRRQHRFHPVQRPFAVLTIQYSKGKENNLEDCEAECAVCLSSFEEEEYLQLLPNCNHSFHAPCIDMWLYSHSQCPLCRASIDRLEPDSDSISTVGLLNGV
ncbi:unnamed protein product [Linum tenue]|uniref:RING-type domain-containing protein n=2 Tax=Linum tenue TaxID=586396 RepID=A0AAV0KB14_9ROSI|nr:unnamed protein product [Linum tenue]